MAIGLKKGTVHLLDHNPLWKEEFEQESKRLQNILPDDVYPYEHTGSTSIPGIPAKPIIDFIAGVSDNERAGSLISLLEENNYTHRSNGDTPERIFFVQGPEECRTHHFSLVVRDSSQWKNTLGFRDYLRANPVIAQEYAELKQELAERYPDDRGSYTRAKESFFQRIFERL